MMKTIQGLKTEFNKEMQTLKKIKARMKMELRNPIIQLEDSRESLTSIMNQTEARMSGHVDKVEDLDQIKNMRKLKTQERNIEEMWDSIKKLNFQTIVIDEGE